MQIETWFSSIILNYVQVRSLHVSAPRRTSTFSHTQKKRTDELPHILSSVSMEYPLIADVPHSVFCFAFAFLWNSKCVRVRVRGAAIFNALQNILLVQLWCCCCCSPNKISGIRCRNFHLVRCINLVLKTAMKFKCT